MAVIDAENLVLGRMAAVVAERLLKGEFIDIVNAEKAAITGNRTQIVAKFKVKLDLSGKGNPLKAPKFSRMPDRIVRRTVRGMLPFKKKRGREAYKRLKTHIGVPDALNSAEFETIEQAKNKGMGKFITVEMLSKGVGAKF